MPTIDEVLKLVGEYQRYDVLTAVDLKSEGVGEEVVRLAEKQVLDKLLLIGKTISEPVVRGGIKQASAKPQTAAVANNPEEFPKAFAAMNADWVHFRYLPPKEQMDAVRSKGKQAFIAGATVSGNVPENWEHAVNVGIDGILTDYPFELVAVAVIQNSPEDDIGPPTTFVLRRDEWQNEQDSTYGFSTGNAFGVKTGVLSIATHCQEHVYGDAAGRRLSDESDSRRRVVRASVVAEGRTNVPHSDNSGAESLLYQRTRTNAG